MTENNYFEKYQDSGILILRIGIGAYFTFVPGLVKLQGGPEMWKLTGSAMSNIGINFFPEFWGFLAMLSEFAGGILLILGLFVRPTAAVISFTMIMATLTEISRNSPYYQAALPLVMLFTLVSLIFLGAGKYSLNNAFFSKRSRRIHV